MDFLSQQKLQTEDSSEAPPAEHMGREHQQSWGHHGDVHLYHSALSTAASILTDEAHGMRSYEIPPSILADDAIRKIIQDVRASADIQKLWFTRESKPSFPIHPI
ncbi:hypothetical protein JB92DRAFT_3133663 [Gautieria morchelliformis]|nr:hypothetical protein JB92DRAFT_3133663 [Gautieria morchelliformis]